MAERDVRERDILVAPNEYAYVQDLTKGDISLYVGPTKISLSNTERLVEYYEKRFVPVRGEEGGLGVKPFVTASSSQYIILENPPKDPNVKPAKGANYSIELLMGRKVVVPGPAAFPLWPGQVATVIAGHELREDNYLVVRVYDCAEGITDPIGTEKIIRGTDVSFYIPETGFEVVPEMGAYVRRAVTLLDGEYCILLAPNGKRHYHRGPSVVFPNPMEEFVQRQGDRVFQAYQLRKNCGLHVRVVKDFEASGDERVPAGRYTAGQELFLKDLEGLFFPDENLEVVAEVTAIPIAEKEGVYVREIETGRVTTETGPKNYLPDPRRVDVISRTLDNETVRLYGLSSKPARAVSIYIPPSYAVLVIGRNKREVVKGPQTRILGYDEDLEVLRLSTGTPKSDEVLLSTCFLLIDGNKVSDVVRVKTRDHVELEVTLSYRVSFISSPEESEKWFNVKNYVSLLCDHLGSIVRGAVRATTIDAFHSSSTEVIRTAILGEKRGDEKRAGRYFSENGMLVYDVEVLEVRILDSDVNRLLSGAQLRAIEFEVNNKQEQMRLSSEQLKEEVNRQIYVAQMASIEQALALEEARKSIALARASLSVETDRLETVGKAQNRAEAMEVSTTAEAAASKRQLELDLRRQEAAVTAFKEQMQALAPDLITTLKVLGEQQMAAELTRNLSPLAILGGGSVAEVVERLLKGLPIGINLRDGELKTRSQK